jgi:hypothetical protein
MRSLRRWLARGARAVALVAVASCRRPGPDATTQQVADQALKGVLAYPRSSFVSMSAGTDAAQLVLTTSAAPQTVADWYRSKLPRSGWELRADAVMRDGSISIYADSGRRPLWITLRANAGEPGTTYTLVGAIPGLDSAAAQRSGSSMSSNRIQRR